jgi:PGF-pre-PGF domain-containing protein
MRKIKINTLLFLLVAVITLSLTIVIAGVADNPPTPSEGQTNDSVIREGDIVLLSVKWTPSNVSAENLTDYIFSWNGTGSCDTWANDTAVDFARTGVEWSNVTKTIPAACGAKTVGWQVWARSHFGTNTSNVTNYTESTLNGTTFVFDDPVAAVSASPSTGITIGMRPTVTCSGTPATYGRNITGITLSDGSTTLCSAVNATTAGVNTSLSCNKKWTAQRTGTFTMTCTVTGVDDETVAATTDLVVAITAGGGTSSGVAVTPKATKTFTIINANEKTTMTITRTDLEVKSISLTLSNPANDVTVSITQKTSVTVNTTSGTLYKYLDITASNLPNTDISEAVIAFRVEKDWLTDKGLGADTVILQRYDGSSWSELSTTKTSEDTDYAYYDATTPGFSIFAITAGLTPTTPTDGTTPDGTTPTDGTKDTTTPTDYTWWIVGIVVLLIIVGAVYYMSTKK